MKIKKILMLLLVFSLSLVLFSCKKDKPDDDKTDDNIYGNLNPDDFPSETDSLKASGTGLDYAIVVFHYQRTKKDYQNWGIWTWGDGDGCRTEISNVDEFGVYYKIDLNDETKGYYHSTHLGYIFFLPDWAAKDDYADDRFIDLDENMLDENNEIHLYTFQGVENMYLTPDKDNPIQVVQNAYYNGIASNNNNCTIFTVATNVVGASYQLLCDGKEIKSGTISSTTFNISCDEKFDILKSYSVIVTFKDGKTYTKQCATTSYYSTEEFINNYTYNGDDLGVTVAADKTTFKLWAPISNAVSVQIWDAGHPTSLRADGDDQAESYNLTRKEKGVWEVTVNENLYGKYYTYTVKNGDKETQNIVDPYAKAAGVNGLRGYIANFSKLNPEGWEYNFKRFYAPQELIIYELHVRDLTMSSTWNGSEANRGKYLGLVESGTTYTKGSETVSTGFDSIKELGVNAIQILPFFDQANDETSDTFNWGYNPQNYNVLEGQYSSDPFDAEARIKEFKQVVQTLTENNIEVIMDVVYNHMNGITGSSFDKIVPGYFFRYNSNGGASNGSGCGNETASENLMFQKYMVDSVLFWVKEYNISGFRFDLMGLHDIPTMKLIAKELKAIDPNIVVYGEPWTGGTSTLPTSSQAIQDNMNIVTGVSAFNESIRDAIKGSVFNLEGGWLSNTGTNSSKIIESVSGKFHNNYIKQINYVSCHDNNTLYDRIALSTDSKGNLLFDEADLAFADVVANGIIFVSKGITFMQAGEELLRSKPIYDKDGKITGYSANSYNLPDSTNAIDWSRKITYKDVFDAYAELIALRNEHSIFVQEVSGKKLDTDGTVLEFNYHYFDEQVRGDDTWSKALVLVGNSEANMDYTLDGQWKVAFSNGNVTVSGSTVKVGKLSIIILYQE